jgi:hypothetical protein
LFGLLFYRGIVVSFKNKKPFFKYLGLGISFSIFLQFLLNAGVVSSALPATGIPLPFFSAGGSSLLITFLMMGVLLGSAVREASPYQDWFARPRGGTMTGKKKNGGFDPRAILEFFRNPLEIRKFLIRAIIVLSVLLALELSVPFFPGPHYADHRLSLLGDDIRISDQELLSWMGYQDNPTILALMKKIWKLSSASILGFVHAMVQKVFPDKLEITVDARKPLVLAFFEISAQEGPSPALGNMLVDEEGVIIAVNDPEPGLSLPVLSGLQGGGGRRRLHLSRDVFTLPP